MLTKKSSVLAILALLALLSGIATSSYLLVVTTIPIFAYLAFSLVFAFYDPNLNLRITRSLDKQTAYEDESCIVTLEILNEGQRIDYLEVIDALPSNLLLEEGLNHHIISLEHGERFSTSYVLKPKVYGYYEIGPTEVIISDILGTKISNRKHMATSPLRVLPKIGYIRRIDIKPKRTRSWPGEIVSKKVGTGMEFYSIREHSPQDSLRRINWKATSKQDERIYTNQFMSELGGDTIIVLDARADSEVGMPPESTVTYSIRAAAIIAYRLLRDRNRVGLVSLGSSLDKVLPGFGKRQFDRLQVALSQVKSGSSWDIRGMGFFLALFFSTMVQIVVVSSLNDKASFDTILDIARRGYRVLVISPSPIDIEEQEVAGKKKGSDLENNVLAARLLRAQRRNMLRELGQVAIVADWNVKRPLSEALQEVTYYWNRQESRLR